MSLEFYLIHIVMRNIFNDFNLDTLNLFNYVVMILLSIILSKIALILVNKVSLFQHKFQFNR